MKCAPMSISTPRSHRPFDRAGKRAAPGGTRCLREREPPSGWRPACALPISAGAAGGKEGRPACSSLYSPWPSVAHLCEFPVGFQVGSIQEAILPAPDLKGSPPGRRSQLQTGPLGLEMKDSWPKLCQGEVHLSRRPSTIHSQDPMGGPASGNLPQG